MSAQQPESEQRRVPRSNIYDRQERIEGWDQTKLENSRIAVVGTGLFANDALATLAGLGIGEIFVFGNERVNGKNSDEYLLFRSESGKSKSEELETILTEINPQLSIKGIHWDMSIASYVENIIPPDVNVIIDAANHPDTEVVLFNYGMNHGIPVINGSCTKRKGSLTALMPSQIQRQFKLKAGERFKINDVSITYLLTDYIHQPEDASTSSLISGHMADEVRKILMPLRKDEAVIEKPLYYDLNSPRRFVEHALIEPSERINHTDYSPQRILVIGAGSLGWNVVMNLASKFRDKKTEITVIDGDTVEEVNLNRQIIYWDCVGQKKALALEQKVRDIYHKKGLVSGIDSWFNEDFKFSDGKFPDLVMDCTDSFKSREAINNYAVKNRLPLISGATSYSAARVLTYVPGRTSCMNCLLDINKKADDERAAASCAHAPEPSVIISNRIGAGLMMGEADMFFAGQPYNGLVIYDSFAPARLGLMPISSVCDCHKKKRG